jgi:UDP-N-acetyl-D-glucosamine dehydrogenase
MTIHLTSPATALLERITNRNAIIGVIGLGYVGLPLARTLHGAGCTVIAFDTDKSKIAYINAGKSYIKHVGDDRIALLASSSRFRATFKFDDLSTCDVLVICLPTPVGAHNEPDMSYVTSAVTQVAGVLRRGVLVVLESTTYPSATDTELTSILDGGSGLAQGVDYFLAYSPEREDPGNKKFSTAMIPKLVGGVGEASGNIARMFYLCGGFERVVLVSSARVAECAKLLENIYRAVNIALVNELKGVFRDMDVDIWEVLDAASTKPFGFQRFDPGPGIGGHCIPVDPFYLAWKAKETSTDACRFIKLAAAINAGMPAKVVGSVQTALNAGRKAVNGARILVLGVAYKPDVDDIRCAPALDVWEGLAALGAEVSYHDPYVGAVCATRRHPALAGAASVGFTREAVDGARYDAVVVITHHTCFGDYAPLDGFLGPIVDTRNCVPKRDGLNIIAG